MCNLRAVEHVLGIEPSGFRQKGEISAVGILCLLLALQRTFYPLPLSAGSAQSARTSS